jgi:hypothetical protein
MNTLAISTSGRPSLRRFLSAITVIAGVYASGSTLLAQAPAPGADGQRRRGGDQNDNGGDRRNASPQDMQARMLTSLRERFEVTDDEEWKVISDRLGKVVELRRSTTTGGFGGFGGFTGRGPQGGNSNDSNRGSRGSRGTTGGNTEITALSAAVRDKLPDAEIKSRLERVRETRKENEAKLSKAQEDLRAVLSVRQEAVAVVFGLLP